MSDLFLAQLMDYLTQQLTIQFYRASLLIDAFENAGDLHVRHLAITLMNRLPRVGSQLFALILLFVTERLVFMIHFEQFSNDKLVVFSLERDT
jgi:hypothetical protein